MVTCADVTATSVPRRPRAADAGRARGRWGAGPALGPPDPPGPARPGPGHVAGLAYGSISHMTELTDVPGAFGYGDSILVGERVRLRGVRDDDLPTLAKWEMDPGRTATLRNWVVPPSEASAKEHIAKWSANQKDDLGFAIETLEDPPLLVGRVGLGARAPRTGVPSSGLPSAASTWKPCASGGAGSPPAAWTGWLTCPAAGGRGGSAS